MILVTHGVVGGALGRLFPQNPLIAFLVGFASHFLLDAAPHWHYHLGSQLKTEDPMQMDMVFGKGFIKDLFKLGFDFAAGIVLSILFFQGWDGFFNPSISMLAGALGAVAPDFLQFVYYKFRREPIKSFYRFHYWIHARRRLDRQPLLGIGSQLLVIAAAVVLTKLFF